MITGPRRSFRPLDAETLNRCYVVERMTTSAIGAQFGASPTTILRRLRELDIPIRPRGPRSAPSSSSISSWSPELAWAVGVIATDGNLSPDGRHLSVTSRDLDLVESLRRSLGLRNRIGRVGRDRPAAYRLQWGSRAFYDWLLGIGLTPAKSLTLGPLTVPDGHFAHFFRGCVDGDGSITTYVDRYNTFKSARYVYLRLCVSMVSASLRFLEWLQATLLRLVSVRGSLTVRRSRSNNDLAHLKYGKRESIALLRWIYADDEAPCLLRKRAVATRFCRDASPSTQGSPVSQPNW